MIDPDQIDPEATKGRKSDRLYRRVDLGWRTYPERRHNIGIVVYAPELEDLVPDARAYIARVLNRMERKSSERVLASTLMWRPVEIPLPE